MLRATFLKRTDDRIHQHHDKNDDHIIKTPHRKCDHRRNKQDVNERTGKLAAKTFHIGWRAALGNSFGPYCVRRAAASLLESPARASVSSDSITAAPTAACQVSGVVAGMGEDKHNEPSSDVLLILYVASFGGFQKRTSGVWTPLPDSSSTTFSAREVPPEAAPPLPEGG